MVVAAVGRRHVTDHAGFVFAAPKDLPLEGGRSLGYWVAAKLPRPADDAYATLVTKKRL